MPTRVWVTVSDHVYVWSGATLAEERERTASGIKRFFAEGEQINGQNYYYTRDHLGSIREMTDSNGTVRSRYEYDPFGVRTRGVNDVEADFGFTGYWHHGPSGLDLALYRAYNPTIGRWLGRDPIGEDGGLNLYRYVSNDPTGRTDLLGLLDLELHSPADRGRLAGPRLPDDPATITVFGHGYIGHIDDQRQAPTYSPIAVRPLDARALAKLIRELPDFPNANRVVLYSCHAGEGKNSLAGQLAKLLGLPVWAPDTSFWISPSARNPVIGVFPAGPTGQPVYNQPGSFLRFPPPSP